MAHLKLSATLLGIGLLAGCGGDDVPADVMQGVWSQCRVDVNVDCSTIALPLSDCKLGLSYLFADGIVRPVEFPIEIEFASQTQSYCVLDRVASYEFAEGVLSIADDGAPSAQWSREPFTIMGDYVRTRLRSYQGEALKTEGCEGILHRMNGLASTGPCP